MQRGSTKLINKYIKGNKWKDRKNSGKERIKDRMEGRKRPNRRKESKRGKDGRKYNEWKKEDWRE